MRYYAYMEYDAKGDHKLTVSEEDIKQMYWPYWYENKCEKYGKELTDKMYTFEHCLKDWIQLYWAWPVNK
jgi:hypothetical protein